jgi:predicted  nucleic acid-binding Zn-ribbon protein
MRKISETERKRALESFYRDNSRKEIGAEIGHSAATVQRVIKEHERKVKENGLIYELSEEGLTEPLEIARLSGEMEKAEIASITDCRDAIPVVLKCRSLKIEGGAVNELIDAAVTLGGNEFPREQFVPSLLRVLRREQATGQTIEQIDSTHQQLTNQVQTLQTTLTTLTGQVKQRESQIGILEAQKTGLEGNIRSAQERLAAFQRQLDMIPVTQTQLQTYIADRNFLATIGFDMNDPARVRIVLVQLRALNFNPTTIINDLVQIGDLDSAIQARTTRSVELQATVTRLTQHVDELGKEIEKLESRLQDLQKQVQNEESETHTKIMNLKQKFIEKLIENNASERDLAGYVAFRDEARKEGLTS